MRSANYQKFLREVNAVPDAEPTLNRADAEPTLNRAGRASREIARKWFTGEALTLNRTLYGTPADHRERLATLVEQQAVHA